MQDARTLTDDGSMLAGSVWAFLLINRNRADYRVEEHREFSSGKFRVVILAAEVLEATQDSNQLVYISIVEALWLELHQKCLQLLE